MKPRIFQDRESGCWMVWDRGRLYPFPPRTHALLLAAINDGRWAQVAPLLLDFDCALVSFPDSLDSDSTGV